MNGDLSKGGFDNGGGEVFPKSSLGNAAAGPEIFRAPFPGSEWLGKGFFFERVHVRLTGHLHCQPHDDQKTIVRGIAKINSK
jgi:hypothetical protein